MQSPNEIIKKIKQKNQILNPSSSESDEEQKQTPQLEGNRAIFDDSSDLQDLRRNLMPAEYLDIEQDSDRFNKVVRINKQVLKGFDLDD